MNGVKIAAIVLIAAGILGLVYGGFSYTKETHDVKLDALAKSRSQFVDFVFHKIRLPYFAHSRRSLFGEG